MSRGQGRSGGYRVLIAFRPAHRAVFILGFAKSARDNISEDELETAKKVGALWLGATPAEIDLAIDEGKLVEVPHENQTEETLSGHRSPVGSGR